MEELVRKIIADQEEKLLDDLTAFQQNYGNRTSFAELNADQLREKLWECLFKYVADDASSSVHFDCLSTLRILSRDKTNLDSILSRERIEIILGTACLINVEETDRNNSYSNITIESLKLLCNLLYNSPKVQQIIPDTPCLQCLMTRVKKYSAGTPHEVMLFDTRIIHLITAVNVSARQTVKTKLHGDVHLIKSLEDISSRYKVNEATPIKMQDVTLACEILRALFNLCIVHDEEADAETKNRNLVRTLHRFLLLNSSDKEHELQSNIVNLLVVLPQESLQALTPSASNGCKSVFQDRDMTAVAALINFLERRLDCSTLDNLYGKLTPVVTAFIRLIREKHVRRYVRLQILPPLKDVMKRPEEGNTLRAKLCKLLTTPVTEVRDLVAEFLFILCKENVGRMVKYTGYGNAAGILAKKGLLRQTWDQPDYSPESEDSDTEEYLLHKEQINPVTGCLEPPKPNPLEGMTEEQKEFEALRLVGLVDKLTRGGVVQPCRIGEDGKPRPIEHVLELQNQQPARHNSDSD